MKRIVILISGRGSNMQALVRACAAGNWGATIVAVISDRPQAAGLDWARSQGLTAQAVERAAWPERDAFDQALMQAIDAHTPDVVVLAGFMRILGDAFVGHYAGRLLNIHPSLLPAFAGLHTHRRALQTGCKFAGATVHLVTPVLDHGPIVLQAAVPVLPHDDEATLAARVLTAEHRIYPQALAWFVRDALVFEGGHVRHRDGAPQWLWVGPETGAPTGAAELTPP